MAVVDDFTATARVRSARAPGLRGLGAGWTAFTRALASGASAAVEYERLSRMSEGQLRSRGLSRDDIPREVHRRHFADLAC